jgi:hypothetical protein
MKRCNRCNQDKDFIGFYKDSSKKDGVKSICIECNKNKYSNNKDILTEKERNRYLIYSKEEKYKERKKNYYQDNKEAIKNCSKKWREDNKEQVKNKNKEYYIKNKDIKLYKYNERLKNDPFFKFIQNIKCNVRNSLTKTGYTKKSKTFEILGIEYLEFRKYIESQFIEDMNWDNYGEWHLDHKTPISWGKNEEEVLLLSHFTNYQPLWAEDNLSKGNRYKS